MGISLSDMSNPYYQRNRVTGYFGYAQYQEVPNLKTFIFVETCGKLATSAAGQELGFRAKTTEIHARNRSRKRAKIK